MSNGHISTMKRVREARTSEQVLVSANVDGKLAKRRMPATWAKKVREMRRDATLGFVRDLYMAPILASEWTVVSDDPKYADAVQLVYDAIVPKRHVYLRHILRGLLDFGWQAFERVQEITPDGQVTIKQVKPLLQDITDILVDAHGEFVGVRNSASTLNNPVELAVNECVLVCRDVEGTNWYGEALMYRAERAYDSWNECDDAARRYDTKIAGAHWVIWYPVGSTPMNGEETDNFEIAKTLLRSLEASGRMAIPNKVLDHITDLNSVDASKMAWRIELISASGTSESSFVGRQKYLDALKSRAIGVPERAVFEGQFGTKAEAEAHADFAIDNIEMGHVDIVEQTNRQISDPLLLLNYGEDYVGRVRVQASPLSDWKRAQLRSLYMAYFQSPEGLAEEIDKIDWDAIREQAGIPVRDETGTSNVGDDSQDEEQDDDPVGQPSAGQPA